MKPVYLEPNEEITSVIEKLTSEGDGNIALVVPKNSSLFQSLVNLKLLSKEAKKLGKEVAIISGNKVGTKLAKQVGVATYSSLGAISSVTTNATAPNISENSAEVEMIDGVPIRQYNPNRPESTEPVGMTETPIEQTVEVPEEVSEEQKPTPVVDEVETKKVVEEEKVVSEEVKDTSTDNNPPADLPPVIARSGALSGDSRNFKIPWKALAIALGLLILLFMAAFFFIPKATVTAVLPAELVSDTLPLSVAVETVEGAIAGSSITSEQTSTKTITTTGKKDVGSKATGTITITNRYRDGGGAGKDQTFAAGTRVTDNNSKKVFALNSAVTVVRVTYNPNNGQPIYDSESVGVTAIEPGESYNVGKTTFAIAGALPDTPAENTQPFSGGLTKQITVFSQEDLDQSLAAVKEELIVAAKADISEKATGQLVIDAAIWLSIKEQTTSKNVGEEASTVEIKVIIEFGAIVFDQSLAEDKLKEKLSATLAENQQLVFDEGAKPTIAFKDYTEDRKTLNIEVSGQGYKVARIDKEAIAASINNMSIAKAQEVVKNDLGAEEVTIKITPGWWMDRLPALTQAINIEYGFNTGEVKVD